MCKYPCVLHTRWWMQIVIVTCWACPNLSLPFTGLKMSCIFLNLYSRPAFLPDPNDGSLYSLGGKNNEGLTVRGNIFLSQTIIPHRLRETHGLVPYSRLKCILSPHVSFSHSKSNAPSSWSYKCGGACMMFHMYHRTYSMLWLCNAHSFIFLKQKLPFTIPELVQASPCRSSDGVLYMGKANSQIEIIIFCLLIQHIHKHTFNTYSVVSLSMTSCSPCPSVSSHLNELVLSGYLPTCGRSLCSFWIWNRLQRKGNLP